jgi:integrase
MNAIAFPTSDTIQALDTILLSGASARTNAEYRNDLVNLGHLIGKSLNGIVELLLSSREAAFVTVGKVKNLMVSAGLSPNTINRRLATTRGLLRVARELSLIDWALEIKNLKAIKVRNTSGPGVERIQSAISDATTAQSARDNAMIILMSTLGLRVAEVQSLNLADFSGEKIAVRRKGHLQTVQMSVPEQTAKAIQTWLSFRGYDVGPLFTSFDRAGKGSGRLTARSIGRITQAKVGCNPHGLRHTAITTAIELAAENNVEFTECRQFSGHSQIDTLLVYRDQTRNVQGVLANAVANRIMGV